MDLGTELGIAVLRSTLLFSVVTNAVVVPPGSGDLG